MSSAAAAGPGTADHSGMSSVLRPTAAETIAGRAAPGNHGVREGIWGTWYDLADADREGFLAWAHERWLPALRQRPGVRWVAHYRYAGGGAQMQQVKSSVVRHADDADLGTGTQYLVLVGADHVHRFFDPYVAELEWPPADAAMLAQRIGVRMAMFAPEAGVAGPAQASSHPDGLPAPAIQMGTLRPTSIAAEADLIQWYAQYRLPSMARMPGSPRTTKFIAVSGWPRHGILYEFESLAARLQYFEQGHESLALEPGHWTNRITRASIHAPGSPFIGERIWPTP